MPPVMVPGTVAKYLKFEAKRKTLYQTLERVICGHANLAQIGGVEMEDLKPLRIALPVSAVYIAAFVGILISLTILTYEQLSSPYLSLSKDPSATCIEVPLSVTGTFEASWDGYWQTNKNFDQGKSLYAVSLVGSSVSTANFTAIFDKFESTLALYGAKAKKRNSAFALLYYASFTLVDKASNMRFYSTAEATDIFFNQLYSTTVSSRNGTCGSRKTAKKYIAGTYDRAEKALVAEVPFILNDTYLGNSAVGLTTAYAETCPTVFRQWQNLDVQYNKSKSGTPAADPAIAANKGPATVKYVFDINAAILAMSINQGFNSVKNLIPLTAKIRIRDANNGGKAPIKDYDKLVAYMDPNSFSPDKIPIYCYNRTAMSWLTDNQRSSSSPDICFLGSHDDGQNFVTLYYPVMAQMANNNDYVDNYGNKRMDPCDCSRQKIAYCNYQDVIWGMIFDRGNKTAPSRLHEIALRAQKFVIDDAEDGDISATEYFQAMLGYSCNVDYGRNVASEPIRQKSPATYTFWAEDKVAGKNQSYADFLKTEWDKICPWGTCASFIFESYADETTYPYLALNKYHVSLTDFPGTETFVDKTYNINPDKEHKLTMCTDTISNTEAMYKLGLEPPVPLTQQYFQCRPTMQTAAINAVGSAAGSAGLALQIGTLIVGTMIVLLTNSALGCMGLEDKRLMSKHNKLEVIHRYDQLKTAALTDMLKASVDTIKALKAADLTQVKRLQLLESKNSLLTDRLDSLERSAVLGVGNLAEGGRKLGVGVFDVLGRIEGVVEDELHELEHAVGVSKRPTVELPGPGPGPGPSVELPEAETDGRAPSPNTLSEEREERTLSSAIHASEEEKKRELLEQMVRPEDDVDFYEAMLVKKFDRVKVLFNMEDVLVAAEERKEARIKAGLSPGDDEGLTLDEELESLRKEEELEALRLRQLELEKANEASSSSGIIGQVGHGLSYFNPFAYMPVDLGINKLGQSPQPQSRLELSPHEKAALQMQSLPKLQDQRYYAASKPNSPWQVNALSAPNYRDRLQNLEDGHGPDYEAGQWDSRIVTAPVVGTSICLGNSSPSRHVAGHDEHFAPQGWDSDSGSDSETDTEPWRAPAASPKKKIVRVRKNKNAESSPSKETPELN